MDGVMIPGTAQIRKIGAQCSSEELMKICAEMASGGYEKKLFSILSRVYAKKKGFHKEDFLGIDEYVATILDSDMPAELKMQTFTSFELADRYVPDMETIEKWVKECPDKRMNIAGHFLKSYADPVSMYPLILGNKTIFKIFVAGADTYKLLDLTDTVIENEPKETVTGLIRGVKANRKHTSYRELAEIKALTDKVFASHSVFYTTKLIFCLGYSVPEACLPPARELYKLLRITINYDERTTREFASVYKLDFNSSDEAVCGYYLKNRKTEKENSLVSRFATHLVRIEDERVKGRLLHQAFKRGGLFRMYAGCMQDGGVNEEKQRRFHYTEEQIAWVKTLPGLKDS